MSEEWTNWISHDGKGCPYPVGTIVHAVFLRGTPTSPTGESVFPIQCKTGGPSWHYNSLDRKDWSNHPDPSKDKAIPIIRYRVKKPKGLIVLETLLRELPILPPRVKLLEKLT